MGVDNSQIRTSGKFESCGKCLRCGYSGPKTAVARHLDKCLDKSSTEEDQVIRLSFEAPRHWIYVDTRVGATLGMVDKLLRKTWLECCGHLSAFEMRGLRLRMNTKVGLVFTEKGQTFSHEYDFGSTTILKDRVAAVRSGPVTHSLVRLLARNDPIPWLCIECGAQATEICTICAYDDEYGGLFCEAHAGDHDHDGDLYLLPVVNSPRMGVCGYKG
jgi:hypothetical protein